MLPVHASSILHGGLVGAGFTWATITMVFTIFIFLFFLGTQMDKSIAEREKVQGETGEQRCSQSFTVHRI